jgi:FixJ family two-component response regulator
MNMTIVPDQLSRSSAMSSSTLPIVFVVDDDVSVRESLEALIASEGFAVKVFDSAQVFLSHPRDAVPSCLVLDVNLPGLNGLELQERIAQDERSRAALEANAEAGEIRTRYASLSPREIEVMGLVVLGLMNKQVGGKLEISEITVKAHRGRVMEKMKARSLADLVRMAAMLGLPTGSTGQQK